MQAGTPSTLRSALSRFAHGAGLWVLVAVCLALLDIWLLIWVPKAGDYKSPLAVPVITFFLFVVVYVVISQRMKGKLLAEMTAAGAVSTTPDMVSTPADPAAPAIPAAPPPAFATEVFTGTHLPALSSAAQELFARSRRIYYQSIVLHRNLVWYLIAAYLVTAFVASRNGFAPLPAKLIWYLLLAAIVLSLLTRPRSSQNSLAQVGWFVFHGLWLGITLYAAGVYLRRMAGLLYRGEFHSGDMAPFGLTIVALTIYVLLFKRAIRRLRREVLSRPPLTLLFLWVFGSFNRLNSLFLGLGAFWRSLGTVQLLQGGEMIGMGADPFRYLRGKTKQIIAVTPEQVAAKISQFEQNPHRWACLYATNTLLCGDQSWRYAVLTLLRDADLVLMDLSHFSPKNAGCTYEIGQLVDKIDRTRFLLLIDGTTDMDFLHVTLQSAWAAMAADSPNRRPDGGPVRIFYLEQEYVKGKDGGPQADLKAIVKDAACLMQLLCAGATAGGATQAGKASSASVAND